MDLSVKTLSLLALASAALLAAACSGDEAIEREQGEAREISFGLDLRFPDDITRAATLATAVNSMHVSCVRHEPGATGGSDYFNNIPYTLDPADNILKSTATYYWLRLGEQYDFYALASGSLTAADISAPAPTVTFSVPADASRHTDLMAAYALNIPDSGPDTDNDGTPDPVPLTFDHLLTAIRFKTSADCENVTIQSLAISGINTTATYTYETGEWDDMTQSATAVSATINKTVTANDIITPTGQATFFMLPQELKGAVMAVTFCFEGESTYHTLYAPLTGIWERGKVVTYVLTIKSNELIVTVAPWIDNNVEVTQEELL